MNNKKVFSPENKMILLNTIQRSITNDVELSTKNDDQRYSIDNSVASFDLVRMSVDDLQKNNASVLNRSAKILPFLSLMLL